MPAFKNLLVPIDFTSNTELAAKKAIDLADSEDSVIRLVHILKEKPSQTNGYPEKLVRLRELKLLIEISVPGVFVDIQIIRAKSIEKAIIEIAIETMPDLVIIARRSGKKLFSFRRKISPARLAKKSLCAVLTLKAGSENTKIKSIVVPFRSQIPKRKLDVLAHLAWKKNATIYLVAMTSDLKDFELGDSSVTHTLIETYRLLKEDVNCQIVNKFISGNNVAKSMFRFAESVNADVLIANPDEMSVSSFAGLDISDMLECDSKMQLLTVEPETYHSN